MSFCNMSSQDVLPGGKTPGLGGSTITAAEEMSQRIPGSGSKSNGQGLRSMNLEKKKMKSLMPRGTWMALVTCDKWKLGEKGSPKL